MPLKMEPKQPDNHHKPVSDNELKELVQLAMVIEHHEVEVDKKGSVREVWSKVVLAFQNVKRHANRERKETVVAALILKKFVCGEHVSKEELKFLKDQSIDIARILPIVAAQAVPAPVPITPFLIALGKKIGIDLVPKEQQIPDSMKDEEE